MNDSASPPSALCRSSTVVMPKVRDLRVRVASVLAIVAVSSCLVPVLATAKAYAQVASDGGIFNYGDAGFYGSTGGSALNRPIVAMAATPDGKGYWLVASDGGIFNYGEAAFYGSTGGSALNRPIVGMAATPDGKGYWLVASDGGIFSYGDAAFYGSMGGKPLNRPIVGMAATPDGKGYWLVASDGGIFSYGDAAFDGSMGGKSLNRPIVGMAATPDAKGYWLVASDGGIFNYGDAAFDGSTGSLALNEPVVGMAATPDAKGYWLVASDGGIFSYGDAAFDGSAGGSKLDNNIVGMAATPDGKGYWLVGSADAMSPPAGYTSQQQILFDDQFAGGSLDTSKWNTYLGAQGGVWNDFGSLPAPYSGPNTPITTEAAMFGPSQVSVDNGLTLTAQRNSNEYAGTFPWLSGVVTTEGRFSLPASGWYVQVKAKMPDMTQGMWPAIWFLPDTPSSPVPEIDLFEGGFLGPAYSSIGTFSNQTGAQNDLIHSDYGGGSSEYADYRDTVTDTGTNLTAGYNVYGIQYIPNVSVNYYFNGKLYFQQLESDPGGVVAGTYELILQLEVASQQTSGWHTQTTGSTPSGSMDVAEVQAYS